MPSSINALHQNRSVGAFPSREESVSDLGSLGTPTSLAQNRVGPNAFAGFVPVYRTQLHDRRGRQRIATSWGEQALDGIKRDDLELVRTALRGELANPEERLVSSGTAGAPFSFAKAALFSQEQVDAVVDDLKQSTRKMNEETKRFVSDAEWLSIDRALVEVGTYTQVVYISRATGGDTGLHLAIRLGSLRAAQVFIEEGCDAAALNDEGLCTVDVLRDNFEKVMELVERIAQLEEDDKRRGSRSRQLNAKEKACLEQRDRVTDKANEYRIFAHGLAYYFDDRLAAMPLLEMEARACEIEGRDIHPSAVRELRLCEAMSRYLAICEAIREREHPILPDLEATCLDAKAERFTGIFHTTREDDPTGPGPLGAGRRGATLSSIRTPHTAGANASLASRLGGSLASTLSAPSGASQLSSATASSAGTEATVVPPQNGRGDYMKRGTQSVMANAPSLGCERAPGSSQVPYNGRSLLSAEWGSSSSKRVPGRIRHGGATMTAGSWTSSGKEGAPLASGGMAGSNEGGLYQIRPFETPQA